MNLDLENGGGMVILPINNRIAAERGGENRACN
jgi:hypothetical protein